MTEMETTGIENSNSEFSAPGLNQIIAKTLLMMCGIYLFLVQFTNIISTFLMFFNHSADYEGTNSLATIIKIIICAVLTISLFAAVIYFLIINNNWLVQKILPAEEPIEAENRSIWITTSLRCGLVFLGLILFGKYTQRIESTIELIIKLPIILRDFTTDIVQGNYPFYKVSPWKTISDVIATIIIIYLILGGPGFVAWQVRRNLRFKI